MFFLISMSTFTRFVWGHINFHPFHHATCQLSPVSSNALSTFTCFIAINFHLLFSSRMTYCLTRNIVGQLSYLMNLNHSLISATFTCWYNFHLLLRVEAQLSPVLSRCMSLFTRFLSSATNFHLFPTMTCEFSPVFENRNVRARYNLA